MSNKVCFIIAHKYYRGYQSFLQHYLENIKKFYPEALTIVVDNNSKYPEDVFAPLRSLSNVVFLINEDESKFELGAYKVGARYIINNDLLSQYSYFIFTQDNFVLKNFFDFDALLERQTYALPINSMSPDNNYMNVCQQVLGPLGLFDNWHNIKFCWCNSFAVAGKKLEQMYGYLKTIVQRTRGDSEGSERYLARLLWELNDRRDCGDIDGDCRDLPQRHYNCWTVDVLGDTSSHFVKRVQQKNEHTKDVE